MPDKNKISGNTIQVLSALVSRAVLAGRLGQQFGGDRDMYQALGYPLIIEYKDYFARYTRQDIAKAIIDRPVKVTWRGDVEIIESDDDKETALEKAWKELDEALGLKSRFVRLDKLSGIGTYGILLLGLDDVKNKEDFIKPVFGGQRKLLYVKPFGQDNATITAWESDTNNPRYAQPVKYDIVITDSGSNVSSQISVHHSRVIHVADEILENETEGAPRLECVYNRLMDLEKVVGGDAEMFWRSARPGFEGKVDKDFQMTPKMIEDLKEQLDEYEHNLRRFLINEGVDINALIQQIADPKNHVDIQIQMIAAVKGIPKRILTGSERGELSSSQDKEEWMSFVQLRREEYAEPKIIRPFVDRCIEYKVLPKPAESYSVKWQDLFAPSEKERVEIGKGRSTALKEYSMNPMAESIVPPEAFLKWFLGLDKDVVKMIEKMRDAVMLEEQQQQATEEEEQIIEEEQIEQG